MRIQFGVLAQKALTVHSIHKRGKYSPIFGYMTISKCIAKHEQAKKHLFPQHVASIIGSFGGKVGRYWGRGQGRYSCMELLFPFMFRLKRLVLELKSLGAEPAYAFWFIVIVLVWLAVIGFSKRYASITHAIIQAVSFIHVVPREINALKPASPTMDRKTSFETEALIQNPDSELPVLRIIKRYIAVSIQLLIDNQSLVHVSPCSTFRHDLPCKTNSIKSLASRTYGSRCILEFVTLIVDSLSK